MCVCVCINVMKVCLWNVSVSVTDTNDFLLRSYVGGQQMPRWTDGRVPCARLSFAFGTTVDALLRFSSRHIVFIEEEQYDHPDVWIDAILMIYNMISPSLVFSR